MIASLFNSISVCNMLINDELAKDVDMYDDALVQRQKQNRQDCINQLRDYYGINTIGA
jgi:hypothetical protein